MIQTYRGLKVDVFDPDPATIDIEDIAHALARIHRFNGHSDISVAQHCVVMARGVRDVELAMALLMHDAAEAYIGDMAKPIKDRLPWWEPFETRLLKTIFERYAIKWPVDEQVKVADKAAIEMEWPLYMLTENGAAWKAAKAEYQFLTLFRQLHERRARMGVRLPFPAMAFTKTVADRLKEVRRCCGQAGYAEPFAYDAEGGKW